MLELRKLDEIDLKVLTWLLGNNESAVPGWIQHAVTEYRHKGIEIDRDRLAKEAENLLGN